MSAVGLTTAPAPMSPSGGGAPHASGGPGGRGAPPGRSPLPPGPRTGIRLPGGAETLVGLGVVTIVALLIVPLPPFILDALSFALALVVLLVTLSCRDPLEFSIFPTLLLLLTLLRLGLNVSSTRLILATGQAGEVIHAFGQFVVGGNVVVGLVIFLILVVINFMVITKGAGRVAEVAARFTLDAMPGRQMSIDADLSAGIIDEHEARRRREEISRYADFYGAMDGSAKFVRGDAIAGLVITAINLVGGFVIGITQQGMSASDALSTFSLLSVGDGLVTQIPALIVSTASGLLVTYGSSGVALGPAISSQLVREPRVLAMAGAILAAFGLVPGLPTLPFLTLAIACGGLAWWLRRKADAEALPLEPEHTDTAPSASAQPALSEVLAVEPLELEVGYGLIPLVDEAQRGDLLQRIGILRKQLAFELGILVPAVRIRDNIQLSANEYLIRVRGVREAGGEIMPRHLFALDSGGATGTLEGVRTQDPSFGLPATWIAHDRRGAAEALGWNVVEPATVLATHLMETIRRHAAELLSRQHVRELLDSLKETHPALVEDTVPGRVPLGTLHRVLQRLLREGLPVRDLAAILESLSDAAETTKDPEMLTEHARRALAPVLAQLLAGADRAVRAITVGPRLELMLMQIFSPRARPEGRAMDPDDLTRALQSLHRIAEETRAEGQYLPLITPPALRVGLRRLIEPVLPRLPVVSLSELPTQTPIHSIRTWEMSHAA